jgi:hypothetical protein
VTQPRARINVSCSRADHIGPEEGHEQRGHLGGDQPVTQPRRIPRANLRRDRILSRSVMSRGICQNGKLAGLGNWEAEAKARTGPRRYGIVGQAPEHRTHTHPHRHTTEYTVFPSTLAQRQVSPMPHCVIDNYVTDTERNGGDRSCFEQVFMCSMACTTFTKVRVACETFLQVVVASSHFKIFWWHRRRLP